MGFQAQNQQMAWQYPFLQYLLSGGRGGPNPAGYNPFFNVYSPAPPGSSTTSAWPTTPSGPGAVPPPVMPPPSSAMIYPPQMAGGASPIGQVPPQPFGAVTAGQGGQGVPGSAGTGATPPAINPAAVPPFVATMPAPPSPLGQTQAPATSGGGGGGGSAPTWVYRGGQYFNQATGQVGTPGQNDIVSLYGGGPGPNGAGIPYSQFVAQGYAGGPFTQTFGPQGGRDTASAAAAAQNAANISANFGAATGGAAQNVNATGQADRPGGIEGQFGGP